MHAAADADLEIKICGWAWLQNLRIHISLHCTMVQGLQQQLLN